MRYLPFALIVLATAALAAGGFFLPTLWWGLIIAAPLLALGVWDLWQTAHSLPRNYPLVGRFRYLLEAIRPQIRQYFIESNTEATPYSRNRRAVIYGRAKSQSDTQPFGTQLDVYQNDYRWINHSITPAKPAERPARVDLGGADCRQPCSLSVFNISAMSFGSLGPNAVEALNLGARRGEFAHNTGEGGISEYHLRHGGDLIWEIGSGYFGCRHADGRFDPDKFAEQAARDQVKAIEIKLSQGAKPGRGGELPAEKVNQAVADARQVEPHQKCQSPAGHDQFSTPLELLQFVSRLRQLSGAKPVGIKLCVGHRWEIFALCKAMLESGTLPDYISIDGTEGGTGAAPLEFSDRVGTPLWEGLALAHNALVGSGLRDRLRVAAGGKLGDSFALASAFALGADWCYAARPFMFALGCVQSRRCHTNQCPTGVTSVDPWRNRALVVEDKARRVSEYHRQTLSGLASLVAAAGLDTPAQLRPQHLYQRGAGGVMSFAEVYPQLAPGSLLDGDVPHDIERDWRAASAARFGLAA